jgi:hypothetical protein
MSYTYDTFVDAAMAAFANIPTTGANANAAFLAAMPTIINQAEQKIYADLQLLATIVRDATASTVANTRNFTLPAPAGASQFTVLQSINIINGADRAPVIKVSREVMDVIYPSDVGVIGVVPNRWALLIDTVILFGPAPATTYQVECIGIIRPAALSETNQTTYLSTQLPGLFFAAAMVTTAGWMRNFGSQADDPKMSLSWQQQYDTLLPLAQGEETARKFAGFYGSS